MSGRRRSDTGPSKPAPHERGLRTAAEQLVVAAPDADPAEPAPMSPEALHHALHELRVHQIELEMQNDELRKTQLRLDASSLRYFELYDLAPVGYCSTTLAGLVVQANLLASRLLGAPRNRLVGMALSQFIFEKDQDTFYLLKKKVIRSGERHTCEVRLTDGGEPAWIQLSVSICQDEANAPVLFMVLNDIHPLKQMQRKLEESEHRWKFAVDGTGDGLWDWQAQADTLFLSPGWKALLGYDEEEIGTGADELWCRIHPVDRAHTEAALQAHLAGATPLFTVEHRLRHKDGHWIWMQNRGKVVARDHGGNALRVIGIHTDISERHETALHLRHLHEQLSQLSRHQDLVTEDERKRIAREIHDDLGQNLLALRLDVAMLHNRTAASHPRLHARAAVVLDCVDRTVRSVREIINNLRPAVLDLGLDAAFEWQAKEFARSSGIRCVLTMTDDGMVPDDRRDTALFRVLQESLTNVARHAQATEVAVRLLGSASGILLEIEDNGRGIHSPLSETTRRSYGLMGLNERVASFGGSFEIENRPGRGVKLMIAIPTKGAAAGHRASAGAGRWGGFFSLFGLGAED